MTVLKKDLLDTLKACMSGVETGKPKLQGADTFVFHDGRIFAYNDSVAVSVPLQLAGLVEDTIEGAVHAMELYKIVSKFSSNEIIFDVKDEHTWHIKCGKAKVELALIDFDYMTRLKGVATKDDGWIQLDSDFITALGSCRIPGNKSAISGTYIRDSVILCSDGYQIDKFTISNTLPEIWLSDESVSEVLKFKDISAVQVNGAWVHFRTDSGIVVSTRTVQGNYKYDTILSIMNKAKATDGCIHASFPKGLFEAIERAGSFGIIIDEHKTVKMTLSKDGIEVSSECTIGKYDEKVEWDTEVSDFDPITVYVDGGMMSYMSRLSCEFYISSAKLPNGKVVPRIMFVTENSIHMMSTFAVD